MFEHLGLPVTQICLILDFVGGNNTMKNRIEEKLSARQQKATGVTEGNLFKKLFFNNSRNICFRFLAAASMPVLIVKTGPSLREQ